MVIQLRGGRGKNNPSLNSSIIRNLYANSKRYLWSFFQVHDRNFGSIIFVDTSHDDDHMTDKIYQNLSRDQKADYFQNESSKRHFPLTKYVCLQLKGLSTKTK